MQPEAFEHRPLSRGFIGSAFLSVGEVLELWFLR